MRGQEPEVLIVGAGPVGLLAALVMKQQGVRVAIIDQNQRASQHSYALAIHPSTLEVLDRVGIADELVSQGTPSAMTAFYEGTERRSEIDFSRLGRKHPFVLVLRQSALERALVDALERLDVRVHWNHRLQSLHEDGALVAEVAQLDQVSTGYPIQRSDWIVSMTFPWRPSFVVGADGYDSTVRRILGIRTNILGEGVLMSVFEVEAEGALPQESRVVLDGSTASVYWPLEPGRCRWAFQIHSASEHEPTLECLRSLLAARAPWFLAKPTQIYWSTYALFENRLVDRFGEGAVWLAGDAAHLATPVGVHSMNAGLREARDLGTRIVEVLRGRADRDLLSAYDIACRAEWRALLEPDSSVAALPQAAGWVERHRARILGSIPASGEDMALLLRQIGLTLRA